MRFGAETIDRDSHECEVEAHDFGRGPPTTVFRTIVYCYHRTELFQNTAFEPNQNTVTSERDTSDHPSEPTQTIETSPPVRCDNDTIGLIHQSTQHYRAKYSRDIRSKQYNIGTDIYSPKHLLDTNDNGTTASRAILSCELQPGTEVHMVTQHAAGRENAAGAQGGSGQSRPVSEQKGQENEQEHTVATPADEATVPSREELLEAIHNRRRRYTSTISKSTVESVR